MNMTRTYAVVSAESTSEELPGGIILCGPAYNEFTMSKAAYACELVSHHRIPPKTTSPLVRTSSN